MQENSALGRRPPRFEVGDIGPTLLPAILYFRSSGSECRVTCTINFGAQTLLDTAGGRGIMQDTSAVDRAVAMVRDLRARCPWDRAQTRETLRPYLVEEVLELDHALGEGGTGPIRDELGDLL